MKLNNYLLSTILLSLGCQAADDSKVLDLNDKNYKDTIEKGTVLVEYFAPWCGHCKALAPEYEKAANELDGSAVTIAKVDCTEQEAICQEAGVKGYPTLKVYNDGVVADYQKARTSDAIVSFMKAQLLPTISTLDKDSIKSFIKDNKISIVAFIKDQESEAYKSFAEVAKQHRNDFTFGSVADADLAKEYDVKDDTIVLFKTFDEGKVVYDGESTTEALFNFIKSSSIPLLADLTPDNFQDYMEAKKPLAYIFTETEEHRTSYEEALRDIAKETKDKLSFVFINATLYGRHAESINLESKFPTFGIQEIEPVGKFPIDQSNDLSPEGIIKHIRDYVSGTLTPSLKSQPIPEPTDDGLTVLVGDNFVDVAHDKSKHVLVEYYATWCGHCKKLAPIYAELAKLYKDVDDVVIANFEATENDLPYKTPYEITGFPTIKLIKAETNEVVDYEGDRTLEGLHEFLKTHAPHAKVELPAPEATPEGEEDEKDEL